jgi:hypothetical protein
MDRRTRDEAGGRDTAQLRRRLEFYGPLLAVRCDVVRRRNSDGAYNALLRYDDATQQWSLSLNRSDE